MERPIKPEEPTLNPAEVADYRFELENYADYLESRIEELARAVEAAENYKHSKGRMVKCQGKKLRQLCNKCKEYIGCDLYNGYVDDWQLLQQSLKNLKEKEQP